MIRYIERAIVTAVTILAAVLWIVTEPIDCDGFGTTRGDNA